jgi:hypothetical protein
VTLADDEVRQEVAGVPAGAQRRRVGANLVEQVGQRGTLSGGEGAVVLRRRGRL